MLRSCALLLLICLPTVMPAQQAGSAGARAVPVRTVAAMVNERPQAVEVVGSVQPWEAVDLAFDLAGRIVELLVEDGADVVAGQILMRCEDAEERAALAEAEAELAEAQRRLAVEQGLLGSGATAEAVALRRAVVAVAEARHQRALHRLDQRSLRAPFAGQLASRQRSPGAHVSAGQAVWRLVDASRLRVRVEVPARQSMALAPDQRLLLRYVANADETTVEIATTVARIEPELDVATRSVGVEAWLEEPPPGLRPGRFISARIETGPPEEGVLVPEEALLREGRNAIVFVVAARRVERRLVTVGERRDGMVLIRDGVDVEERVVVRGVQGLRDGMMVVEESAQDAP